MVAGKSKRTIVEERIKREKKRAKKNVNELIDKKIKSIKKRKSKDKTYYGSPSLKAGDNDGVYDRSELLNLKEILEPVVIIGLGGTGSLLAIVLPLYGCQNITLIDNDKVENSNRGRGLFRKKDVGRYKTTAVKELILERRSSIKIRTITDKFDPLIDFNICKNKIVFDCTDDFKLMDHLSSRSSIVNYMKLGYDGLNITLINGKKPKFWNFSTTPEQENAYRFVPSFIVPPMIVVSLALMELLIPNTQNKCTTLDVSTILETFNYLPTIYSKLNVQTIKELFNKIDELQSNKGTDKNSS